MLSSTRVKEALMDLPVLHVLPDQIDYTIYDSENRNFEKCQKTERVDMNRVAYVATCTGDAIFWDAVVQLYTARIKFIPKIEADHFVQSCWSEHIRMTTTNISNHRLDNVLRNGERSPVFSDVVIMSLLFGLDVVAGRPWYRLWASTYNKRYTMPEKIRDITKSENIPAGPGTPSQRPNALVISDKKMSSERLVDDCNHKDRLKIKEFGGRSETSAYKQTGLQSFLKPSGLARENTSEFTGAAFAVAQPTTPENEDNLRDSDIWIRKALDRQANDIRKVKGQQRAEMEKKVPLREPGARRTSALRAEERTRHLYEIYPAGDSEANSGQGTELKTMGNKRLCQKSTVSGMTITPGSSPQPAIVGSKQPQTERTMLPARKRDVKSTSDKGILQMFETAIAEEQRILSKAREMEATLQIKRAEVLSLESELESMYERLATARMRGFQ